MMSRAPAGQRPRLSFECDQTSIMAEAPAISMKFRSAVEMETTAAALIWVASAVSGDTTSPPPADSKKADDGEVRCENAPRRKSRRCARQA